MLFQLPEYGVLTVGGRDAKKLLQGQLTCHMDEVTTKGARAALCNPKGRVISFFNIALSENIFYLIMPTPMLSITLTALKKYAHFYKVDLSSDHDRYVVGFQSQNKPAEPLMLSLFWSDTRGIGLTSASFINKYFGNPHRVENPAASRGVFEINQESSPVLWKYYDIQEGIPALYPETSSIFLPHELNLPQLGAVSFNKGCYTGQEIIARMHYRGKLKNHLYQATTQAKYALIPGQAIYSSPDFSSTPCGTVVDVCVYDNRNHALIVTDHQHAEQKQLFFLHDHSSKCEAIILN